MDAESYCVSNGALARERELLEAWTRRRTSARRWRCARGSCWRRRRGESNTEIAARLGVHRNTVRVVALAVCAEFRLDGLLDEPRPGQPRTITDAQVEEVITKTLESTPKNATHWSTRSMAAEVGLTQTAVSRIWRAFGLQPHRQETWKLSKDPLFVDEGPRRRRPLSEPARARGGAVRGREVPDPGAGSDRADPADAPGMPERATHDYKRHGTIEPLCRAGHHHRQGDRPLHSRHRAIEFKQFLQTIDREVPAELDVHLVLDNASTHKTPLIKRWLLAHPRFVLHFTPTSDSWLNLVERWFGELTTKKLRRGAHRSVRALNADIRAWIETWNDDPKPYVWTKTADQILESITRYCTRINDSRH